jgi:protein-S-isoprenylcysteine O-methyltransferase Ste14
VKRALIIARPLISTGVFASVMAVAGRGRDPITQAYLAVFGSVGAAATLATRNKLVRDEIHDSNHSIDRGVPLLASLLFVATVIVSAFDAGRFHWSPALPTALRISALGVLILVGALQAWAMAANPFFSPSLSIRSGHRLIARGPYRFIRHPGYLAMAISLPATAVVLGSVAGLLPGLGYDLLILNRTMREDGFLRNKLGGYAEYARIVRYRIIPCLW